MIDLMQTGMELVLNSSDEDFMVAIRGLCENSDNSGIIRGLFSIMEEPEISMPMQYKALRVLHKVLLSIPPSSLHMELREFMRLQTIIENTSQYPGSRKSCLAICILADLCCRTKDRAAIENVFGCSSLPSHVISLIKDHIKLLLMPLFEDSQNDLTICQELQRLLKILLTVVENHPSLGCLVLDNIKEVIEYYLVTVASTDRAVRSTHLAVNFKGKKQNSFIFKFLSKIYRFLVACLDNLYVVGAIDTEVISKVNILAEIVCQCSLIDCYTYLLYHLLLHSQPICDGLVHENDETHPASCLIKCTTFVNKVLTGTNGWTAYKVGAHAACQGEWSMATIIFRTLIQKVKSVSCCSWLNALFHYSNSEEKFQLPKQPKQGTTSIIELVGTIEFPLSCDYKDDICPRLARKIYDCNYYDQLTQSHMELCSSLKILEASATSSQEFCFQRWFLSLRARVLENLVCVVKTLREVLLNVDQNLNQVETESNDKLQFLKSCQDFNQISLQLFRLAEEFNLLRASFIGMDSESSEVLAAHSLSSSVLAFVTAFGVSNIDQNSHRIFVGVKSSRSGYRACSIRYKDREVVNVCTYVVSSAVCLLQKTASEFTKNALSLVSSTLIKLMHIHLGIPKYFFKVRPFIGAELFLHNEDSVNGVEISVAHGSHITLNILRPSLSHVDKLWGTHSLYLKLGKMVKYLN
ncbi:uncharacterized protein HKW66_Vig0189060 [Vigna angularis]|uniref:Integrator complex subunit 7 n=1 Tax=Phaseolus angularis TaxID=3914 RepID=A0A8T0KWB8_PHAAN|nr:uncharacterized protein HKW66_Vig0189060 [Vigna angularis]